MKKILSSLVLVGIIISMSYSSFTKNAEAATTNLSFSQIPLTDPDLVAPGRGMEHWFNWFDWDNVSTVQVPAGNRKGQDMYIRINWAQIENAGSGTTPANPRYNWTTFDQYLNAAIDNGMKLNFGILNMAEGYGPYGSPGGALLSYPTYVHNQMQAEAVKDWTYGGQWIPNWNSNSYLTALENLNTAIAQHIATGTYNGKAYKDVVGYIDIRGYGNFGEWHNYPWVDVIPSGAVATSATLKRIIDSHKTAFPNYQLVIPMGAFDTLASSSSRVPADVAYYALTTTNPWGQIGWRRDNWGVSFYDWDTLRDNPGTYLGVAFKDLIMNKWKSAPIVGEPNTDGTTNACVNSAGTSYASCSFNYQDLPREVSLYHPMSVGNGNFSGATGISSQQTKDSIISASKLMGYRLILEGGTTNNTVSPGGTLPISLNWKNIGVAPAYENWDVVYELRNQVSGASVWSGVSTFKPRMFLPATTSTTVNDSFVLPTTIPNGTYNLVMTVKDPIGYRKPLPLAITGRALDGSYTISTGIVVGNSGTTTATNTPPVANAGVDQTIYSPTSSVTLSGSASDGQGAVVSYSWSKIAGGSATITSPLSPVTTVTGLALGTYTFRLTSVDNGGLSSFDDMVVNVLSSPVTASSVPLSFTVKPTSDPEIISPGRGTQFWNWVSWDNAQAPQIPNGSNETKASTLYVRFRWSEAGGSTGRGLEGATQGSYLFSGSNDANFDFWAKMAINNGQKLSFGIMTVMDGLSYPTYVHNQMQAESVKDYSSSAGWIPNWNSPTYLSRYEALLNALSNYINTTSYTPTTGPNAGKTIRYKDIIEYVDIRGYGLTGEWHNYPYWQDAGYQGLVASSATLKRIIDAHRNAFPDFPLVIPIAAFDGGNAAVTPADVSWYALTATNNWGKIGWRRDDMGEIGGEALAANNTGSYTDSTGTHSFASEITSKYKTAPVTGEPINGGGQYAQGGSPYYYLPTQVANSHFMGFGNGNYPAGTFSTQTAKDNIINASKASGYRIQISGGSISSTLSPNMPFAVTLNWRNTGASPLYQKNRIVKFELRNSSDAVVQTWTSSFNPTMFLPSTTDTSVTDVFNLGNVPSGTGYKLLVSIPDTTGYQQPLSLALNIPARNTDGTYTIYTGLSVGGSTSVTDTSAPTVPAGLSASGTSSTGTSLSWTASTDNVGVTGYKLYQNGVQIATAPTASYVVSGLTQGTSYSFTVSAYDAAGNASSQSVPVVVNTTTTPPTSDTTPPTIPTGLSSISTTQTGLTLSWTASTDNVAVTGYKIYKAGVQIGTSTTTSYAVTGLTAGTAYSFTVSAYDAAGNSSAQSTAVSVTTTATTVVSTKFVIGDRIYVSIGPVKVRQTASSTGTLLGTQPLNALGTVIAGPIKKNGYVRWQINYDNAPDGWSAEGNLSVYVPPTPTPVNQAPVVNAGVDQSITLPTNSVTVSGTATDPENQAMTYAWTKISGGSATITSPNNLATTITGLTQGTYTFWLTATDSLGASNADAIMITVNPAVVVVPVNQAPTANAGVDQTITLPTSQVTLSGSGTDTDGTISSHSWTRISGSGTITSASSASTTVTGLTAGTSVFRLTVTDNGGLTASDDMVVTVNAAPVVQAPTSPVVFAVNPQMSSNNTATNTISAVPAGALLVMSVAQPDDSAEPTPTITSTPQLTWTKQVDPQAVHSGNVEIYTAVYTAGGNISVTTTWGVNALSSVLYAITGYDTTSPIGAVATSISQATPSTVINTTKQNSLIIGAISDWNAVSVPARNYLDQVVETAYQFTTGGYTAMHFRKQAQAVGPYTEGLSGVTGMSAGTALIEIKGN